MSWDGVVGHLMRMLGGSARNLGAYLMLAMAWALSLVEARTRV